MTYLNKEETGRRLRLARECAGVGQREAAAAINMPQPMLAAIEAGREAIRVQEILLLTQHYGLSVSGLPRCEAVHTDMVPRFRRMPDAGGDDILEAARLLATLATAETDLERHLDLERSRQYPPEQSIAEGDVIALAGEHAQGLRDWLELGSGPVADIFSVIELMGVRLYQRFLSPDSKVASLFIHDDMVGACILLNAGHSLERRTEAAAHALGRLVGLRSAPDVLRAGGQCQTRGERYAGAFGRTFLMPRQSVGEYFHQLVAGAAMLTRRHVILLAYRYGVAPETCVRRLEELQLLKQGAWDAFRRNGGINDGHVQEVLGGTAQRPDPARVDAERLAPRRISVMAHDAWQRELVSEGFLSDLLDLALIDVRQLVDEIAIEKEVTDDLLKLPCR